MPDFLTNAACRGKRPSHLMAYRLYPRPHLVAKLLRERHVARFVVAPDGFGKTTLAMEYADTVFSFDHVFWIDATSPCFLRDLDKGGIAEGIAARDAAPALVVVDDVPPLGPERSARLSAEIDRVLDRGCEVLVSCSPMGDTFARHHDRVLLSSADLLLTDAELDLMRTAGECREEPAADVAPTGRVPALAWGFDGSRAALLAAAAREELPADVLLSLFVVLMMGEGGLDEVAVLVPHGDEALRMLAGQYCYAGIDLDAGRFGAAPFTVDEVARAFKGRLSALAERSSLPDADALALRMADAAYALGSFERACDAARLLAGKEARASWLAEHAPSLAREACLVPACAVYRSLDAGARSGALALGEALRRMLLGDAKAAAAAARRASAAPAVPADVRMAATWVLALVAGADAARERAVSSAMQAAQVWRAAGRTPEGRSALAGPAALGGDAADSIAEAIGVAAALCRSWEDGARAWADAFGADAPAGGRDALSPDPLGVPPAGAWAAMIAAAHVLRSASEGAQRSAPSYSQDMERMARSVAACARGQADGGALGLAGAVALSELERAAEHGVVAWPAVGERMRADARRLELLLYGQRDACERERRERAVRRRTYNATHPNAFRSAPGPAAPLARRYPLLTVNLFGGLEVRIGDTRVDDAWFRRKKVRSLLALLVLNRGREFPRDKLVAMLWPDSDVDAARKNFYGIWSILRRALAAPDGTCPYLIRHQNGLRIDADLLASDVEEADDLCKALLFDGPARGGWSHLYSQVEGKFSDDLMPSDDDNAFVEGLRADYRNRLVDALVAASGRLVEAGAAREGLWFARAALQRDRSREDAYVALMRAQISSLQRTAAMDTYFECRRYLAEELGIDPSPETLQLYRGIIEEEMVLA